MRVGIDARFITRQPRRGIGNYSLNLVLELIKKNPQIDFILYIAVPDTENILPQGANVRLCHLSSFGYPFWEQIALPRAAKRDNLDILHCLGNTAPLFLDHSIKLVLSLMDVMFLQSGEFVPVPSNYYQALGRLYRKAVVPTCTRAADQVITISEFSKQDILDKIRGLEESRLHVTYLSCDAIFKENSERQMPLIPAMSEKQSYIFALGAEDPRKNTLRVVKAYLNIIKNNAINEHLVISGYANWENSASHRAVIEANATDKVHFLSFIKIEELAGLYRSASFFIYPSLYEGFGIPIVEAFSSCCPLIASDLTSIPEVAGDAAILIDPNDQGSMEESMLEMLSNKELRRSLIELGKKRAQKFSWELAAEKTTSIYKLCMGAF